MFEGLQQSQPTGRSVSINLGAYLRLVRPDGNDKKDPGLSGLYHTNVTQERTPEK